MQDADALIHSELLTDPAIFRRCQQALREDGVMVLRDFATEEGLELLRREVLTAPFNECANHMTAWQDQGDPSYPADHPRNYKYDSTVAFAGRQTLERTEHARGVALYFNDQLIEFLSRVAGRELYRSVDENGSVYAYRIHKQHDAPWHFDESPYTAIIYLENGHGGSLELLPWSRPTTDKGDKHGHQNVQDVLMNGDISKIRRVSPEPGTLVLFNGAHSFHRAAPISSGLRVGLVFTFGLNRAFSNSSDVKNNNEWDPNSKL